MNSHVWIKFNKLCGVWILFRTPKLRTAVRVYQPSSTRLNSYMKLWFFMNSCMNSIYEFCARTLFGTPEFTVFHEFMPDIMILNSFHGRYLIRNHVWRISWRISWKLEWNDGRFVWIELNSSLNLIDFMARCADAPYLTGPGHSAAAAPEPPAPLSACLFQ